MQRKSKNSYLIILLVLIIVIVFCGCSQKETELDFVLTETTQLVSSLELETKIETTKSLENEITVHICGAVKNPGVYVLKAGTYYQEVLEAAGGVRKDAAKDYLNLAKKAVDGEKIYVPFLDEVDNPYGLAETAVQMEGTIEKSEEVSNGLVNINTADSLTLQTLNGIGESRAQAIIAYREEHGNFNSIEEIMQVPGIKEGSFAKIKDAITV